MFNSLFIRNKHLTAAIQQHLRAGLSLNDAVACAAKGPAPRYYVGIFRK